MTQLSSAVLATFVGGQLEIVNDFEGYLYRGEIESARFDEPTDEHSGGIVVVRFKWLAKSTDSGWVSDPTLDYKVDLAIYKPQWLHHLGSPYDARLLLNGWVNHEIATFFPKGWESELSFSDVKQK